MRPFKNIQTIAAKAPIAAIFNDLENQFGFVPNLYRVVADSASATLALHTMNNQFSACNLTAIEQEVVALTVSAQNGCIYCVSAHSKFASQLDMDSETLSALREQRSLVDEKLNALRTFTLQTMAAAGHASQEELVRFFDAGFSPAQAIDVVLGITVKTLTNYVSSLTAVPLDDAFKAHRWTPLAGPENKNLALPQIQSILERSAHYG